LSKLLSLVALSIFPWRNNKQTIISLGNDSKEIGRYYLRFFLLFAGKFIF
jgi:hypothetical protein